MASEEKDQERGFTIVDKRGGAGEEEGAAPEPSEEHAAGTLPGVDFSTFCLSLGTSALYHLGVVGEPETGETAPEPNLPLARQTIDILEMLRVKTQGNLAEQELTLIESLLYELRMHYVEADKKAGPASEKSGG
jgi:hypothetical protein